VTSDTAVDLAEAVVELLDDPEQRRAMGQVGRARIEGELGWPAQAESYVAAYQRVCARTDVARPREVTA
jgi:glycosyltransferase involved in cell wall biosynthesis